MDKIIVSAAQVVPVFLDRAATIEKACDLISVAGRIVPENCGQYELLSLPEEQPLNDGQTKICKTEQDGGKIKLRDRQRAAGRGILERRKQ